MSLQDTVLHAALRAGHEDIAQRLVSDDVDIDVGALNDAVSVNHTIALVIFLHAHHQIKPSNCDLFQNTK